MNSKITNSKKLTRKKKTEDNKPRLSQSITHPTTIPHVLAIAIWVIVSILLIFFDIELSGKSLLAIIIPTSSLLCLSGIIILVKKEAISKNGDLVHGVNAIIYGVFWLILGLGIGYLGTVKALFP